MKKYLMIACRILEDEINVALGEKDVNYPILYLPQHLHTFPKKLNEYLQELLDRIENIDYIILPMGRCGNATIGLKSKTATLVLPKCEDCINLLLSDESVKVQRPFYTSFFTNGWLKSDNSIDKEYAATVEKYGEEQARMVMDMMYSGYKYFSIIDTGAYDKAAVIKRLEPMAEIVNVEINELPGKFGVLKKMIHLDWDDNFVLIPPNVEVKAEDFE